MADHRESPARHELPDIDATALTTARAVDRLLAAAAEIKSGAVRPDEARAIEAGFLTAYRWQYIHSGAAHPHFGRVLSGLITEPQSQRIQAALSALR